jgi:hypothetical protein
VNGLFGLDGNYVGDLSHTPLKPVQGTLFAMHVDRQRKPAARLAEPTLMDFLADHPKRESF